MVFDNMRITVFLLTDSPLWSSERVVRRAMVTQTSSEVPSTSDTVVEAEMEDIVIYQDRLTPSSYIPMSAMKRVALGSRAR